MKKQLLSAVIIWLMACTYVTAQSMGIGMPRGKFDTMQLKKEVGEVSKKASEKGNPEKDLATAPMQKIIRNIADDQADIFGFLLYDYTFRTRGVVNFTSDNPYEMRMLKNYGYKDGEHVLGCGTMVGDKYWAILYESWFTGIIYHAVGLGTIDLETGEFDMKFDYKALEFDTKLSEMTYDPRSNKIYAASDSGSEEHNSVILYEIDLNGDGLPTELGLIDKYLYTLAASNGYLYGIANDNYENPTNSILYKIDPTNLNAATGTFEAEQIGSGLGRIIGFSQTMEFDHTTHKLWWIGQAKNGAWISEVSTETGKMVSVKDIHSEAQVVAMAIRYQTAADEAPSFVRNLTVTPGEEGAPNATLTWENPTTNYQLGQLSALSGVKIYRNNELLQTLTGGETSWTDTEVPPGTYTYRVQTYNEAGDGLYKERTSFVGRDVPGPARNVRLTAEGSVGTLTWEEPATGLYGGWYDKSSLLYVVLRMPDYYTLGSTPNTTMQDMVEVLEGYSYIIITMNSDGQGDRALSNIVSYGPALDVPFISPLATTKEFNRWQVLDANEDGNTWTYTEGIEYTTYMFNGNPANDYLATPPLNMEAGEQYQIRYEYRTGQDPTCYERMEVVWGEKATPEKLTNQIALYDALQSGSWTRGIATMTAPETRPYSMSLHCISDAEQWYITLRNISVRHYSNTDLSVAELKGSEIINENKPAIYKLLVVNEGKVRQENYTVQLINSEDNSVLAEEGGVAVAPGDTVEVEISWTPVGQGKIAIQGNVILENDTYPLDNKSINTIYVTVQDENAPLWLTIGTKENTTYINPAYVMQKYSQTQTLYYRDELNLTKSTQLLGIEYAYRGDANCETMIDIPMQVYIQNTELEALENGFLSDDSFTLVYDGSVDLDAADGTDSIMTMLFNEPFEYTGKNICVKIVRPMSDKNAGNPFWYMFEDIAHPQRAYSYRNSQAYKEGVTSPDDIWECAYTPYTKIAYKENVSSIQQGKEADKLYATYQNGVIRLSDLCDEVRLISITGTVLYSGKDVKEIPAANLTSGIYMLNASYKHKNRMIKLGIK